MAFMVGLGHAAAVVQLVGTATVLIHRIIGAAETASENKEKCAYLARRLSIINQVLSELPRVPVMEEPLKELERTLCEASDLVLACQNRSVVRRLKRWFGGRRHAARFREVNDRIDSNLVLFPMLTYTAMASRLDPLLPPDDNGVPSLDSSSDSLAPPTQMVSWIFDNPRMLRRAEIAVETNLAVDLGLFNSGRVYKGRLLDGPDVAVKVLDTHGRQGVEDAFMAERYILSRLRHDHIVHLVGWCVDGEYGRMLVYEHMGNGTLRDHLQPVGGGSTSSPVTTSWRTRVEVLLGASRAIQYLHRAADPLVIHRNVSSSNILLDGSWAPRLSGFGSAVFQEAVKEHAGQSVAEVVGTPGYIDPEYIRTNHVSPASDVYSFGVVILEALTGRPPVSDVTLPDPALSAIQNGELRDVLDGRPALQPTPRELEALDLVAHTARWCLCQRGRSRPSMSSVVANLQTALRTLRKDEPMSWARLSLM